MGDLVRYSGAEGVIEFIIDQQSRGAADEWYLREHGPGVMISEPKVFGSVYVSEPQDDEDLEFIARGRGRGKPCEGASEPDNAPAEARKEGGQ